MSSDRRADFLGYKIKQLELERLRLSSEREEIERELEKVEYALKALNEPVLTDSHGVELKVTKGGSLKGVQETLIEFLNRHQKVATASEMAHALCSFRIKLTVSQLKRRFSVVASAMFKNHDVPMLIDSGLKNASREIYWALPEWMNESELKERFKPNEENM